MIAFKMSMWPMFLSPWMPPLDGLIGARLLLPSGIDSRGQHPHRARLTGPPTARMAHRWVVGISERPVLPWTPAQISLINASGPANQRGRIAL